jgi:SAM-dependent methyltransferase
MGEGGVFQRMLIGPVAEQLLALQPGERVLDIACGNGGFSRRMAALGAVGVASDFSPKFIQLARARTVENADRITYQVVDATDEAQLLALGEASFDAAVCTMGIMDMPAVDPLMSGVRRLLRPGGRFVFSVMHPCFNGEQITKGVDELKVRDEENSQQAATTARTEVPAAAAPQPMIQAGPGVDIGAGRRACVKNDSTPPGAVVDGLRKVVTESPFGPVCRWEPVK